MEISKQIIFYGAGKYAANILGKNPKIEAIPAPPALECGVCFVDSDTRKHGTIYLGMPIVSVETALAKYSFADIYITIEDYNVKRTIFVSLIKMGVSIERIINGVRLSCHYLENFVVCGYHEGAFGGKAGDDCGSHSLKSCCSDYGKNNVAFIPIDDDITKTFNDFIKLRDNTIKKLNKGEPTKCDGCIELKFLDQLCHPLKSQFSYVIFNELGICNCKCSYCNYQERLGRDTSVDVDFVKLMQLVNEYGFDSENGIIELCNGEIAIHPQKKKIYKAVKEYRIMFLTNGLVYDKFIHKKLENGTGILNLSLDCGTRETFKKVKGLNAFDRVVGNLRKYVRHNKGILNLKFIFLPGINDNNEDIEGFINLCIELNVTNVHISYNLCLSYIDYNNEQTIFAIKHMIESLEKKSIPFEIYSRNIITMIERNVKRIENFDNTKSKKEQICST